MDQRRHKQISKFLSLILRHRPDLVKIQLDQAGWVSVDELLEACHQARTHIEKWELIEVVQNNDKQRFSFSTDRRYIRANQGHSIPVQLDLMPKSPPHTLFHGTATRFLKLIQAEGLKKQSRHHVHLSDNQEVAVQVGSRYGKPVILSIQAQEMEKEGYLFYQSANGVWLTDHVPLQFICFPNHLEK